MKKVVLLAVNAKYVHSSLSVWVIAAGISEYARMPYELHVIESTINQSCADIAGRVAETKPDVIGISTYIWNAGMMPELLSLLRKHLPDIIIILGGPEASNNIQYWLDNGADHVLKGEGEYCFPQFLDSLFYEADDARIGTDSPCHVDWTDDPFIEPVDPYTDAYFNALNGKLTYIETSRGCPFQCSFCLSAGSGVRYFPLDMVKQQICKLSQSSSKTIKFVDRTFNCNTDRAFEIFEYIIGLETSCTFHFEVAADLFNDKILSLLQSAPPGRIQFEIGLQSFHGPALKASSRQMDADKAESNIRALLLMQNIHIHIDLIAGLPYESLPDFMNSFDRAYALGAHTLQLGFLKLLHGSVLREQAETFNIKYSSDPPYEVISTSWLNNEDIQVLKNTENALQHTYNKGRFLSTLHYMLSITGKRPFELMQILGTSAPNHGTQLEDYAVQVYDVFSKLPNVETASLQDCMTYDWLTMVKGKNAPEFMKNKNDDRRKLLANIAENRLGRKIRREEYAILNSGIGIFVDNSDQNPVTGLYKVNFCRLD